MRRASAPCRSARPSTSQPLAPAPLLPLTAGVLVFLVVSWSLLGPRLAKRTSWLTESSTACLLGLVTGVLLLIAHSIHSVEWSIIQQLLEFNAAGFFTCVGVCVHAWGGAAREQGLGCGSGMASPNGGRASGRRFASVPPAASTRVPNSWHFVAACTSVVCAAVELALSPRGALCPTPTHSPMPLLPPHTLSALPSMQPCSYLLPPVIWYAGLSVEKSLFFANLPSSECPTSMEASIPAACMLVATCAPL